MKYTHDILFTAIILLMCQMKYTHDILKKFGMDKAKSIKTPMGTNGHLDLDLGGTSIDQKVYCSMIGSLLYLCVSRHNIIVCICVQDPKPHPKIII
jgi:hypothetical protein